MITNIPGSKVLIDIMNKLCDCADVPDDCKYQIIETVAKYEHNIITGRRMIVHIEAAIINIMMILCEYENTNTNIKKN